MAPGTAEKEAPGPICSYVFGEPVVSLDYLFCNILVNVKIKYPPEIPSTVTSMSNTFYWTGLLYAPLIPHGVQDIFQAFWNCSSMTGDVVVPASVTNSTNAFRGCSKLGSIVYSD